MELISEAVRELFAICAAAAAMECLLGDARGVPVFRSLCALAVATGAVRLLLSIMI